MCLDVGGAGGEEVGHRHRGEGGRGHCGILVESALNHGGITQEKINAQYRKR